MGGLNSGPGPGITLLIAIVLVLVQTVSSAPLYEEDDGQESNSQALAESHGCYYNFQHYNEGERILTNEPCLNCTCRNRMLMCYLRVCPFTKGIGQNCTVEKVPGQCCPIITCPEVPVQLLTSTTTEGVKSPGTFHSTKETAVGHLDTNGCNIDGIFYPNGAQVPGSPEKPCELCYCIRNKTACIMQECALHVDGCRPVYEEGQCFPVRYQCDDSPYEEEPTTTIRPPPTPGLIITTTSSEPLDCAYNNEVYEDGSRIQTEDPCEHCYCLKGKIACAVQECGAPLEKEGQNCTALPAAPGKCCPDSYQCDITMASQGNQGNKETVEEGIPSGEDAGHPTDGYHPDQTTRTTEEPHYTTNRFNQVTEAKETFQQKPAATPGVKPQELDKGTQYESTESHLGGLHSMKPSSTSDDDQKITFPDDKEHGAKPSEITFENGRPGEAITKRPESEYHTTESHVIHMSHEKQPHPESESHKQDASTAVPQTGKPLDHQMSGHPQEMDLNLPNVSSTHSTQFHEQNTQEPTTHDILRPQTSAPNTKDPLLDKLHNIIQDVQSQVSDGKTTEMPEQTDYQTISQSQTGYFTDKPDILAHLPHFGSQTSTSSFIEAGNSTGGSTSEEGNDIINKLQGIIQGIYSHVTDSVMSTKISESTTAVSDTQPVHPTDAGIVQSQGGSHLLTPEPEKDGMKPLSESKYPGKPDGIQRPNDKGDLDIAGKPNHEDKYPFEHSTKIPKPEEDSYQTEYPESTHVPQGLKHPTKTQFESQDSYVTKYPEGTSVSVISEGSDADMKKPHASKPQGSIKLPQRPKPSSADEPQSTKYPETTDIIEEESPSTEDLYVTGRPDQTTYPQGTSKYPEKVNPENEDEKYSEFSGATKIPLDTDKYPAGHKPYNENFEKTTYPENDEVSERPHDQNYHSEKFPSEKHPEQYPHKKRPAGHYPQGVKPFGEYPEKHKPEQQQYPEKTKPLDTEESSYGTEYSEGYTSRPADYTEHSEGIRPTEYPSRKPTEHQSNNYEPGQTYSITKPTGQRPEEYKPSQFPEKYKPFGQYPHETKPTGEEPEKYKPESFKPGAPHQEVPKPLETEEETLYGTDYPEGVTERPGSEGLSGHYPDKYRPQHQYSGGSKPIGQYPVEAKPFVTEETPFGTEYSEGNTGEPEEHTKYPEVIEPSEKNPHEETSLGQYPEKYQPEKYPTGSKPTGQYSGGARPEESYYEGVRPTAEYPDETKPLGMDFTKYPESLTEMTTSHGMYPSKLKPSGSEFTKDKTESLESTSSEPDEESQNPEDITLTGHFQETSKPTGQNLEETEQKAAPKPSDSHQDEKYPEGSNHPDSMTTLEKGKPSSETRPETQDLDRVKPTNGPDHSVEPENVSHSTEYPGSVTGKPGDSDIYPTGFSRPGIPQSSTLQGSYVTKYPEPSEVTGFHHIKHPISGKPHDFDGDQEKQTESKPYGTESPEKSGDPNGSSEYPEKPNLSIKHPQKNKPDHSLVTGYTEETGTFKPEDEYLNELKPTKNHTEVLHHPETSGFTDGSEHPEVHSSSTQYPEEPIHPLDSGKPHDSSTQSPELEGITFGSERPDNIGVYGTLLTTGKYSEDSTSPAYGTKFQGSVPDKLENDSKYPGKFRPTSEQSPGSKYPVTDKSQNTEKYSEESGITGKPEGESEYPEEFTSTSKYPVTMSPDDSELKPGSHYETSGTKYPKPSSKPETMHEYSQSIHPEKNKPTELESFGIDHSEDFNPTEKYPGESGFTSEKPEKLGVGGNQFYSTGYPDSTERPDQKYSEHLNENLLTTSPDKNKQGYHKQEVTKIPVGGSDHSQKPKPEDDIVTTERPEYPEGIKDEETGTEAAESGVGLYPGVHKRPTGSIKRPQKPKPGDTTKYPEMHITGETESDGVIEGNVTEKPEIGQKHPQKPGVIGDKPVSHENYPEKKPSAEYPEATGVTEESDSEDKLHGTNFPEGVTGRPDDLSQHPDRTKIPSKPPQKLRPEFTQEGFTERPEQGVTESDKYLEETYTTHYAEKLKPPNAEDQFLETVTKLDGTLSKDSQKTKPSSEKNEGGKPEEGTKYPEVSEPYESGIHGQQASFTKSPYLTKKPPQKPNDKVKPSVSEYSEESSEHPEKLKPVKYPGKPEEPDYLPYNTEYPETTKRPDELKPHYTLYPNENENGITEKPYDISRYPEKQGDKIKHSPATVSGEKPFDSSTAGKPIYVHKETQDSEHSTKSKPDSDRPHEIESLETKPSGTEYPEGVTDNPEYGAHRPEKFSSTEKFGVTKHPVEGIKYSKKPESKPFENEYTEAGTDRPIKYSDKPAGQKLPYDSVYSGGQTHLSEYPEGFTTVEYSFETEYLNSKVTDKPENQENIEPAKHHPEIPQSSIKYPEEKKPQLPHGDKHSSKKPDTIASEGIQPEVNKPYSEEITARPENTEFPEAFGSTGKPQDSESFYETEQPEGLTSSSEHDTKYPLGFSSTGLYLDVTDKPLKFPEGLSSTEKPHTSESIYSTKYSEEITGKPEDYTKYSEATYKGPVTKKPDELKPTEEQFGRPQDIYTNKPNDSELNYDSEGLTGRPEDSSMYPEHDDVGHYPGKPQDKYPEGVTGAPDDSTNHPEGFRPTGHYPGITGGPVDHTKYPEENKPVGQHDTEPHEKNKFPEVGKPVASGFPYGTEHPEDVTGILEDHTKYPVDFRPTEQYLGEPYESSGKPQDSDKVEKPHGSKFPFGSEYPEKVAETHDDHTKHPDSFKPFEQHLGKPSSANKLPGVSKPNNSETSFNAEYPEGVTGFPDDVTKYPSGSGITVNSGDQTELPEGYKPTEQYPGKPHKTDKYPMIGKPQGSERVTDKPHDHTKHPEGVPTASSEDTKTPDDSKVTLPSKRPEGSESTDPVYSTENPHFSGVTQEYSEKFTPDISKEGEPTESYPSESEGVQPTEKPTSQSETRKPGISTKLPEIKTPTGSENIPYGNHYPEGVPDEQEYYTYPGLKPTEKYTGIPHNTNKYSEDAKPQGSVYPEEDSKYPDKTEYPEGTTEKPFEGTEYPEISKPTDGYGYPQTDELHVPVKYPAQKPKPESEGQTQVYQETSGRPNEQHEHTRYPDDGSTFAPLSKPESQETGITGQSGEFIQHPEKPGLLSTENYSESVGITVVPQTATKHPTGDLLGTQLPEGAGKPQDLTEYQSGEKPEHSHTGVTAFTSEKPDIKYTKKPKPTDSNDILYSTKYPEKIDIEEDTESTETPEHLSKLPEHSKPSESEGKPYGTEYPENETTRPENDNFYTGISKQPTKHPQKPKPEIEKVQQSTKSPEETGFGGKPINEIKYPDKTGYVTEEPHVTEHTDEHQKPTSAYDHQNSKVSEESGKYPRPSSEHPHSPVKHPEIFGEDSHPGYRPQNEYPEGFHPTDKHSEGLKKPHVPSKSPQTPKPSGLNESYDSAHSEVTKKPETVSHNTEYPEEIESTLRPKPTGFGDELFGTKHPETEFDDDSTTKLPVGFGQYPVRPGSDTEYPGEKPSKFPVEDIETVGTKLPDEKQKPEGIKPFETETLKETTEKPVLKPTSEHFETLEVTGKPHTLTDYPGKPNDNENTESPSPMEVTKDNNYGVMKPVSSTAISTEELSTEYPDLDSTSGPETAYLPQSGQLPKEKIPSSEHLDEESAPEVSEYPAHTETISEFTDRIPATGSVAEEDLLSNLHHFEDNSDKPSSADLTYEHQTLSPNEHSGQHSTSESFHLNTHELMHSTAKPFDKTKPTGSDEVKPDRDTPVSGDGYSGKPKPVVPSEELYNENNSTLFLTHPSETQGVPSTSEHSIRRPTTARPETGHPGTQQDITGDVKYPGDVSIGKPEEDYTNSNTHKDSTSKQPLEGGQDSQEPTKHPEIPSESFEEHTVHEIHPEGTEFHSGGFNGRPVLNESNAGESQGISLAEENSTEVATDVQKPSTPADNDLINKLHNIISGIQSQVTKTTKPPKEGYHSTSPFGLSTESIQSLHPTTSDSEFGRPSQKPEDSDRPSQGQVPDSSNAPIDDHSEFENEIYDHTTIAEENENQTNRPDHVYPIEGGSTEDSIKIPSKGPEGIYPDGASDGFLSTQSPNEQVTILYGSKPVKTESTDYPIVENQSNLQSGQASQTSKYPVSEILSTGKPDGDFSLTELSKGRPSSSNISHESPTQSEKATAQTPEKSTESTQHPFTPQSFQEIKGNKNATGDSANLTTEDEKVTQQQSITGDALHTVTPHDGSHKHTPSVFTDKPLHVVYPTYYPEGVITRKPGSKPDQEADKKVTVTPESIPLGGLSSKSPESGSTGTPEEETHTVYEVQTEISSESTTSSSVVIIQEVHTEVHSERATTKPETEGYVKGTIKPVTEDESKLSSGKPQGSKPDEPKPGETVEGFTKHPEFSGPTPQIVFGRPIITHPTEDKLIPESQTLQPHDGSSESEISPNLSTYPDYPPKQSESTVKPGLVTVTPVGFSPVTKESQHIMHLYSPKDKYPESTSSPQYSQSFTTSSPIYTEEVKHTTEKEQTTAFTESRPGFITVSSGGATHKPEIMGTRFPSRKTTQKPTDGIPVMQEGTTITPTEGIGEAQQVSHHVYPGVTEQPPFVFSTQGLPTEITGHTTTAEKVPQPSKGASYVPYKLKNGTKVYFPEKETLQEPVTSDSSEFDGYDLMPYEIVNGTKFFYPNRVVTPPPAFTTTTGPTQMGMYVPYKKVNGTKVYYTQGKPEKPEKFDGLDYVPFDIVNGTKVFYPERVTTTPPPTSAMYVPFKIINDTKVYYPKDAHDEPQDIPDEYDGFDYIPYDVVDGKKVFRPERLPGHVTEMTERFPAMYVPYKIINGNKIYYPKDAKIKPETVPQGYDGFDFVPYEVINGTKVFQPDRVVSEVEQTTQTPAMFVPYKIINGTKVYFPKYAQVKPTYTTEGYDGFDYLPYEDVNGTKIFRPEQTTQKPQFASTPAFYPNGMFVPYKIINNKKVFFPKDAQHKPRPLKPGYDGVQFLPYDVINGTKVFYPERVTTPAPVESSAMYVPFKHINGTKVYYADKATESPEEVPEGYEGFDYLPYEIVNGNKIFYPSRVAPTMGMYVPYKKINGTKVYYPKDSSETQQSIPEGYEGVDYVPFQLINGTKVFYPDRATPTRPASAMYVPYKTVNGKKVYYPKDAQSKPYLVPEGYDGFDYLPYEIVNGTKVFHPEDIFEPPAPEHSLGMFVPFKVVNGTKIYYPLEAHQRPHPLTDEYAGIDYIPYEIINGTKVFHPERVTPGAVPAMYVPYKLINGTKMFYPKHAQYNPQEVPAEYDGFDYVPYEIINGTQVFYTNRVPSYQGMYVPYKIINGKKVFYPEYAQHKPSQGLDGYDGFDFLPYENVNGTKVFKPTETETGTPFEQAMYVPYKLVNGTKVFYPKHAQFKPYLIPEGYDGFDYIPYDIVNGTKVFDPELVATPETPNKPAMYVPFKIINGKKVYYPKHAQNKPHLLPNGYDGFDYIPYDVINGTKVFNPQHIIKPGTTFKPALYVPYRLVNGTKVYQPKYAEQKPTQVPQGYDGVDHLPYDVIGGNKVFYPAQSEYPIKEAMYVPYKLANGTKVFYPKYAQYVLTETPDGHDGFEYIPYEIVNGEKVFHPEVAVAPETPLRKAMYVPYKIVNETKVYYPKYAHHNPLLIPSGYDGFDYLPYEVVEGNKIFHPEQATPGTSFKKAMYVPFRLVNGTKVYDPNQAQFKPQFIPDGYDGFDYLPYEVVNGTKVFDAKVPTKPTYLQGMYVPYKLANNTKVFYPKDAHNKPNRVPPGYSGADYVPYELVNNTKMFYPELISTAQPSDSGSAGVYVPFRIINNKKVFYPKEATPFPPTVRHPYDGVAFVPNKALPGTISSEIVYVDNEEALKPFSQPGQVPGEGNCYLNNRTFANNTEIPPVSPCQTKCVCLSSVVRCVRVKCPTPPENKLDCSPVYREGSCCPTYVCGDQEYSTTYGYPGTKAPEFLGSSSLGYDMYDSTTPFTDISVQKKPNESGGVKGGSRPEEEASSGEYHLHKPPKPKPGQPESLEPYDNVEGQLSPDEDYDIEDEEPYGPGTCRYAGKVYVSAQQIPRDDPCDFCFCFRSDIICLQQSCPPPIPGCRDEPIQGFCCPRYECHVKMATLLNVTSTTTTTTTTLPPHFLPHAFKGSATRTGCFVQGRAYRVGQPISSASGPCMDCICGGNGRMKCEPKVCTPEPMIRKMISPSENTTSSTYER